MKAKLKIDDLLDNEVIHIRTRKEARKIVSLLKNRKWSTGEPYTEENICYMLEKNIKNGICLYINNGSFDKLEYFVKHDFKIHPAKDFFPRKYKSKKRIKELEARIEKLADKVRQISNKKVQINATAEFTELPEKWCVRVENQEVVDYCNEYGTIPPYTINSEHFAHFPSLPEGWTTHISVEKGYTEISFADFKRLVLKDDDKAKLEVGKWYKGQENDKILLWYIESVNADDEIIRGYGFLNNEWKSSQTLYRNYKNYNWAIQNLIPATNEEVESALVAEAKRRGFKRDITIIPVGYNNKQKISEPFHKVYLTGEPSINSSSPEKEWTNCSNPPILKNGQWAEIIAEPEIDLSKPGQLVDSGNGILVLTTGGVPEHENSFTGVALYESSSWDKGAHRRDWDKRVFKPYTGSITLSN